jgi:hypothetical protein
MRNAWRRETSEPRRVKYSDRVNNVTADDSEEPEAPVVTEVEEDGEVVMVVVTGVEVTVTATARPARGIADTVALAELLSPYVVIENAA